MTGTELYYHSQAVISSVSCRDELLAEGGVQEALEGGSSKGRALEGTPPDPTPPPAQSFSAQNRQNLDLLIYEHLITKEEGWTGAKCHLSPQFQQGLSLLRLSR